MIARFYKKCTWLSLDVTAGAIVFMCFLSKEFDTSVRPNEAIALGISVWLIYTIDHLLDARVGSSLVTERRKFHHRHFNLLLIFCGLLAVAGIWIVNLLQTEIVIYGITMGVIAAGYLALACHQKWASFKEIQIALGYALGVSLVPVVRLEAIEAWHLFALGMLFLTALTNLILFSWFEIEADRREGFGSMVLNLGERNLTFLLRLMIGLSIAGLLALVISRGSSPLALFFLASTAINFLIWRYPLFFKHSQRYRVVGDAVFLLPLIWLIW